MASVPFIKTLALTVDLDGHLRTHQRAQGAALAAFLDELRGMIALGVDLVRELDGSLGTYGYAELAGLA